MSVDLIHPANGSPKVPSPGQAGPRHRKRSSSLFALDELSLPSPPLSPSVSINVSSDTDVSGEIPIIFDFLTTSPMPSEERISRMASLKPGLPPLARFSPMSAFFPMSGSSGTLNTIGTQVFGTNRPGSYCSQVGAQRYSTLSDFPAVDSPFDAEFDLPSPTSPIAPEDHNHAQDLIAPSESTPGVQVLDYDVGQKSLGDVSHFTISAYLASPSVYGDDSGSLQPSDSNVSIGGLGSAPASQETSLQGECTNVVSSSERSSQFHLVTMRNGLLSAPSSPNSDDKTPTQSTFSKRQSCGSTAPQSCPSSSSPEAKRASTVSSTVTCGQSLSTMDFASTSGSLLTALRSPDFDDKTPTQATFMKRQTDVMPLARSPTPQNLHLDAANVSSLRPSSSASDIEAQSSRYPGFEQRKGSATTYDSDDVAETAKVGMSLTNDSTGPPSPTLSNPLPVPCLKHAQWLRDTVVELWIDQEGFRAIRPKFFLASVSNGLPYSQDQCMHGPFGMAELTDEHDPLYTTVAEFLPVSRAAHYFHHAALDRAPTLNRITAGGDETRDYITRAATLALRDNGVFFVHGTEDHRVDAERPAPGNGGGGRVMRLNWRFEYFVSSRRPDGRSAHRGEKVITPLSFSCTPALLDRSRANKVKVLHIMKKTLLPNLVAQKLEPPDLPILQTQTSVSSLASVVSIPMSESRVSVASHKSSKSIFSKSGLRSRRGSVSDQTADALRSFVPPKLKSPSRPPLPYTKHRRGSHSETTPEDFMRRRNRAAGHATHERSRSASSFDHDAFKDLPERVPLVNNALLIGPIISQGELLRLLDSEGTVDVDRRPDPVRLEVFDNTEMTTLPAAPRHRQNQY